MNILLIILLFLAARGIFALYNDLKKVVIVEREPGDWNSFEGYKSEKEQIKETWERR